ncbi:GGDEF domain-containing protein [Paenisporosarcina indica]|uniref:GGDEF domain-containing protein n=1 Tax=Paenisporosarcina indica TaxID=650093 RepID=UPI00094FB0A8|nr:diguanylate cyclase [Paenisporosarcina indica]
MISIKEYLINFSILLSIIYVSGFLYKQFLVNSKKKFIEYTLVLIGIFAGWCSMIFGIHITHAAIFDLRLIPVIIAAMYSPNLFYILVIGSGIGLTRFSFGATPAATNGLYIMIIISVIAMLLSWISREWTRTNKMIFLVVALNIINTILIALIGVVPFNIYISVIVPTVFPVNIILSFVLLWMVKDLSDEYLNKINLLNSSRKDPLTQLYNRRAFMTYFEKFTSGKMDAYPLSIVFVDIDHFKQVNDRHGHLVGDIVLQKVSQVLSNNLRSIDVIARYGGEEFVIIFPKCNQTEVLHVIERIRKITEETPFIVNDRHIQLTLSAGVATAPEIKASQLLKKADEALYIAKGNGRNQIQYATT